MATKKAAAKAEKETKGTKETKKATNAVTAAVEKVVEAVEEKKTAKKTAPKKTAPKKPAEVKEAVAKAAAEVKEEVKAVEAPAAPAEAKVNFYVEFGGVQVSVADVIANVKATYGKDAKEISVYLKPDESKAYFVADGEAGTMDVFFC